MKILDLIQMFTLLEDIERYDVSTFRHCVRVNSLAMQIADNLGSVSYTHLDVYKRQVVLNCY